MIFSVACYGSAVIFGRSPLHQEYEDEVATYIMALKGYNKWALSGTPIQNCLRDLHTLLNFIDIPDTEYKTSDAVNATLKKVMLLRTKKDVGMDIPEKTEIQHLVTPTEFEREVQSYVMNCLRLRDT